MVGPKKESLAIAEGELKAAEDKLSIKKAMNSGTSWSVFNRLHWRPPKPNPSGLLWFAAKAGAFGCDSAIQIVHSFYLGKWPKFG